jgi:hypothetical protein
MWWNLEQQVGISEIEDKQSAEPETPADNIAGLIRRRPQRHGRRVLRSSYLS